MNFEEKTLNSKVVYDGKVITVLKDDIVTSDGHKSFREVAVHNGGVVIVALKDDDKILLVKQYAAPRELEEETGYRANSWQSLGYINTTPGICTEKLYLYFAKDLTFVGEHPDEGEVIKCFEYKISDVFNMIKNGEINDAKTICALCRAFCKEFCS